MGRMPDFIVCYDGRPDHDSRESAGRPYARKVQAIVQTPPDGEPEVVTGADYYVRRQDGTWCGVDKFGLFDYLLDSGLVLFGTMCPKEEYRKLIRRAIGIKETWLPGERKP